MIFMVSCTKEAVVFDDNELVDLRSESKVLDNERVSVFGDGLNGDLGSSNSPGVGGKNSLPCEADVDGWGMISGDECAIEFGSDPDVSFDYLEGRPEAFVMILEQWEPDLVEWIFIGELQLNILNQETVMDRVLLTVEGFTIDDLMETGFKIQYRYFED